MMTALFADPAALSAHPAARKCQPQWLSPSRPRHSSVPARPAPPRLGAATIPVSATLAANETMDARRRRGEPVLPLAFGEAGLPAHRMLRAALARAAGFNSYGPVAGHAALREAAACYWARRGLPTDAEAVICGPGSKALLFGLMAAIGGDVAVTRPSWVSYAAQASLAGRAAHFVPGSGRACPTPEQLARTVSAARAAGRRIRSVIVTLPDNPTGLAGLSRGRARPVRGRRRRTI